MRFAAFTLAALVLWTPVSQAQSLFHVDPEVERANLHYTRGWEAFRVEDWATASREFQVAIDIKPRFKLAYYGLGRAFMGLKRFSDATRAYEACRNLYAADASERFRGAQEADQIRQADLDALKSAINTLSARTQGQQNAQGTQNQVRQLRDQAQRIQQKRDVINNNLSIASEVPAFLSLALGSAFFRAERFADAERAYKTAVDADPKFGEAWNNLAALYLTTGRIDDADRAVAAAEKVGYKVNPGLKDDIRRKKSDK
jgi:tetratricopeptide (TPR) repeat protein